MTKSERFWSHVHKSDGCWLWTGWRNTHRGGYGVWSVRQQKIYAHRMAWELTHGPIPATLSVLHHCDNPPCVRPDHLFLGTQRDNWQDCKVKGRAYVIPPMPGSMNPKWHGGRRAYYDRRNQRRRLEWQRLQQTPEWDAIRLERNAKWRENYHKRRERHLAAR